MKNKNIYFVIVSTMLLVLILILAINKRSESQNKLNQESNQKTENEIQEMDQVYLKNGDTYDLTVANIKKTVAGKEQEMVSYNGTIPGPTIYVHEGDEININLINKTDHDQYLHSHGVRMENKYDGSQLTQDPIKTGESFTYKLKFKDPGVYWYHPHSSEVVDQARGLYGGFVVLPKENDYFEKVNSEKLIFLSDILIDQDGNINENQNDYTLMGHYGNHIFINGIENFTMDAKAGDVLRLYLINSANARPFNFAIPKAKLKLLGGDSGAYEKESFVDSVVLGPGERYIVDVYLEKEDSYLIENKTPESTKTIGEIVVKGKTEKDYSERFNTLEKNKYFEKSIYQFKKYSDKSVDKRLRLDISMNMMGNQEMSGMNMNGMHMMGGRMMSNMSMGQSDDGIEWEDSSQDMNSYSNTDNVKWKIVDIDTNKENMDIRWTLSKNSPTKIEIYNNPDSMHPMQHPIHFHGQRFLILSRDGKKEDNLVWKDTVLVKAGEKVVILLDNSNSGDWMSHCHTSEHLNDGMNFEFVVK